MKTHPSLTMKKVVLAALALICAAAPAHPQNFSAEDLAKRTIERRAVEAVIWGMSAVNYDLMQTVPGKGWFPYLRFYSPTEAFFNQTWKPDDIVEMN
jgi:hypothetical protein